MEGYRSMRKLEMESDWLEFGTYVEIESLSYYLYKLYAHLGNMQEDFMEWTKSEVEKTEDAEEKEKFYHINLVDYWQFTKVLPRLFLNSFHVAAYSLLETKIYCIAREVGKKQSQQFDVSEIRRGNYLESAVYYIKKLTGINAKTFSCWGDLVDGQKLRNIIVHSNGNMTKKSDTDLAKKCGVYDYDASRGSGKEVAITHDYCSRFIDLLKTFFSEMYTQTKAGNFL